MSWLSRVTIVVFLIVSTGAVAVGTPQMMQTTDAHSMSELNRTSTDIGIEMRASGDAHWHVNMSIELPDDANEAFEETARDFESGSTEVLTVDTFQAFAERSSETSGRDMKISNISRKATITNNTGYLELGFVWEEFGRREGSELTVNDAFSSSDGLWLQGLADGQNLSIRAPESSDITTAPKGYTNKTIKWVGPRDFEQSDFSIAYTVTDTRDGGVGRSTLGIAIAILILVGLGVYAFRTLDTSLPGRPTPESTDEEPDRTVEETSAPADSGDEPPLDRELLQDEEYVEQLIKRNGGRMKQANIVKETGWSNAKVSQLLSSMAEEDQIEKLRIGRENLISLPDTEIEE